MNGENEQIIVLDAASYNDKNYVYFDMTNNTVVDREPPKEDWHLLFTRWISDDYLPAEQVVTGVWQNKNVDVAENGKTALDMFGLNRYDIILMDIQMPVMNGITATKKIREIEKTINTHTPIIAITANAMLGDKETCLAAGIDDYLSKPYQMEDLISKMNNLLF